MRRIAVWCLMAAVLALFTAPGWFPAFAAFVIYPEAHGHALAIAGVVCLIAASLVWVLSMLVWRLRMLAVLVLGAGMIAFGVQLTVTGARLWPTGAHGLELQQLVGYALLCALVVLAGVVLILFVAVAWMTLEIDDGAIFQAVTVVCIFFGFLVAALFTAAGSSRAGVAIFIATLVLSLVLTAFADPVSLVWG